MKRPPSRHSRAAVLAPIVTALFVCALPFILAEMPAWWRERSVVKTDAAGQPVAASDFAAANQGQLKNTAIAAYEEFLAKIPAELGSIGEDTPPVPAHPADKGSPGWRLRNLVSQWVQINRSTGRILRADLNGQGHPTGTYSVNGSGARKPATSAGTAKDFAAINLGQIKAVAAPFYDRLWELYWSYNKATPATAQIDPAWAKPWTGIPEDANDHAMATLGQLKNVFAIHLESDGDGDGLNNIAELLANRNRSLTDAAKWTDLGNAYTTGGALSDGEQVTMDLDPTVPSNGRPPDAPTRLHITFRDAAMHPEDPDLSKINVEWMAPPAGITVSFSSTYAGASGDWIPGSFSGGKSEDITVPHSKRVYQYRVTFTGPNQLTASTDIAYELPVIRGIMKRSVWTTSQFSGVALHTGEGSPGVPHKFKSYTHSWNYDSSLSDTSHTVSEYTYDHIDGSLEQTIYLSTNAEYANSYQNQTGSYISGNSSQNDSQGVTYVANRALPFPGSSSSSVSSQLGLGSGSVSSYYFSWPVTAVADDDLVDATDETSFTLRLNPFAIRNAMGVSQPYLPFATYTGSNTVNATNYPSVLTQNGELVPGDVTWASTAALQQDSGGQYTLWTGTIVNSPYGLPEYTDDLNYGNSERFFATQIHTWPGRFYVSGIRGPRLGVAQFDYPPYGDYYPSTPVIDNTVPSQVSWSRSYDHTSHPAGPETTLTENWTETVTVSAPVTTDEWVSDIAGTIGSPSLVSWYIPGGEDPRYNTQYEYTNHSNYTHFVSPNTSFPTQWVMRADYTSAAPPDLVGAGYPVDGYATATPNISALVGQYSLWSQLEDICQLLSSEYKFRIYPPAESCQIQWLETFTSDTPIGLTPELQYKVRTVNVALWQTNDTPVQIVDRTQGWTNTSAPQEAGTTVHEVLQGIVTLGGPLLIEVLKPTLDSQGNDTGGLEQAYQLKVAKWEHAWNTDIPVGDLREDFIDHDPDRFYVRIPALGGGPNGVKLKLSTERFSTPIDGVAEIEMQADPQHPDKLISQSQIMVADGPDKAASGAINSNVVAKRTHKTKIFGFLKVEFESGQFTTVRKFPAPDFRSLKGVNIHARILRDRPGGAAPQTEAFVRNDISDNLEPRYLQAGIYFSNINDILEIDPPEDIRAGVDITRHIEHVPKGLVLLHSKQFNAILDAAGAVSTKDIYIFYVNGFIENKLPAPSILGYSLPDSNVFGEEKKYANSVFISKKMDIHTTAHEVGHVLTNKNHINDDIPEGDPEHKLLILRHNLMFAGDVPGTPRKVDNTVLDSKRIQNDQVNAILANKHMRLH